MAGLNAKELKKALEIILKDMQQKGMLPKDAQIDLDDIAEKLYKMDIQREHLNSSSFKKMLGLALVNDFVSKVKPELKFDWTVLFERNLEPDILKKELKKEFKKLFEALNELTPNSKFTPKAVDDLAEKLAERITKQYELKPNSDRVIAADKEMTKVVDIIGESLRSIFGMNPNKPGEVKVPVLYIIGNLTGIADQSGVSNAVSGAFIDEYNSFQGKEDYLGIENVVRERLDSVSNVVEQDLIINDAEDRLQFEKLSSTAPKNDML